MTKKEKHNKTSHTRTQSYFHHFWDHCIELQNFSETYLNHNYNLPNSNSNLKPSLQPQM